MIADRIIIAFGVGFDILFLCNRRSHYLFSSLGAVWKCIWRNEKTQTYVAAANNSANKVSV